MKILFVCVGNTCRSQMAEGFARHYGLNAYSAGTDTHAKKVASLAVDVMNEIGIDVSKQSPTHLDQFEKETFDLVISMGCGVVCPNHKKIDYDWGLEDPYGHTIEKYRETRDEIKRRILEIIE